MCELLAMSANTPTDLRFSFAGLARRGGSTGPHRDGWGAAFYEGAAARVFREPDASAHSPIAAFLARHPIKTEIAVAHVRRANRGKVCLANTHPFTRELHGATWTFAHNGQLKGVKQRPLQRFHPVGGTDSEHAFCWLLDRVAAAFPKRPTDVALAGVVAAAAADLATLGVFNMVVSDGRSLFAWATTRLCFLTRRAPFGAARLADDDVVADFATETTPDDVVTILATRPLTTNESWTPAPQNTLLTFRRGLLIKSSDQPARVDAAPSARRRPNRASPLAALSGANASVEYS